MGSLPAWSMAMRPASTSVATTSCPAYDKQPPVTSPTYPHPITAKRKRGPPVQRQPERNRPLVDHSAQTRSLRPRAQSKESECAKKSKSHSAWLDGASEIVCNALIAYCLLD